MTDVSPGWRRHDRTHLEINLEHLADDRERTWDAWIFLPQSFRLTPATYSESQICSDLKSLIRFSIPHLDLTDVPRAVEELVDVIVGADAVDHRDELRIFACRVREAIARDTYRVRMMATDDGVLSDLAELVHAAQAAMTSIRRKLLPLTEGIDKATFRLARRVDEHLSRCVESAMIKLATDLNDLRDPPEEVSRMVTDAAVAEAQYRAEIGAGPVASARSTTRDLELVERRTHALKRLTSAVLWLETEITDTRGRVEHGLHAIAAGIAMTFAVGAALLYGAPTGATDLWVWGGLVVLAYMAKDRIKAALQVRFSRYIDDRYPSRSWVIGTSGGDQLATATEKVRFVDFDSLPEGVARFRRDLGRDVLGEEFEIESIIHHRKTILVGSRPVHAVDPRYTSITEILRLHVGRWLAHTDDPTRSVTLADPASGELFESSLPRAYDVTIIYRMAPNGEQPEWNAARVVLSRKGIRRVDQLDV